jgi:hypothetical protein
VVKNLLKHLLLPLQLPLQHQLLLLTPHPLQLLLLLLLQWLLLQTQQRSKQVLTKKADVNVGFFIAYRSLSLWGPLLIQITEPDKARVKNYDDAYA